MRRWIALLLVSLSSAAYAAAESSAEPGTALITGSDRGIGFALVQEFASRGGEVNAAGRDPAKSTELNAFAQARSRVFKPRTQRLRVSHAARVI